MNKFLKPFIHKKFGPVNAALYNIFNGDVFHITNDLSPKALMQNLEEGDMLYMTKGCKPLNIELPMPHRYENGLLRRVNIRLGLSDNGYCWDCKPQKEEVNEQVFNRIIEEIKGVYAETVFLDFYEYNLELIKPFLLNYKYSKVNIKTVVKLKKEELDKLNEIHDDIVIRDDFDFYNEEFSGNKYYYHKSFHPCPGHSMAIDNDGNVKPYDFIYFVDLKDYVISKMDFNGKVIKKIKIKHKEKEFSQKQLDTWLSKKTSIIASYPSKLWSATFIIKIKDGFAIGKREDYSPKEIEYITADYFTWDMEFKGKIKLPIFDNWNSTEVSCHVSEDIFYYKEPCFYTIKQEEEADFIIKWEIVEGNKE